jgi:hypothetical protein
MNTLQKPIKISNFIILFFGSLITIFGIILISLGFLITTGVFIIGLLMLISGIVSVIAYRHNRNKVINVLKNYERISIGQLSSELKLTERKIQNLIIDLRANGRIKISFDPITGDVFILEADGEPPFAVVPMSSSGLPEYDAKYKDYQIPKDQDYCSNCGSILKTNAKFCIVCCNYIGE